MTRKIVFAGALMNISAVGFITMRRQWKQMERERDAKKERAEIEASLESGDMQCFFAARQYLYERCTEFDLVKEMDSESCKKMEAVILQCRQDIYNQLPAQTACMQPLPRPFNE
eukprot:GEMP01124308.1.p1 GENE.GEMP01124308.1~~GEMP01124308.1.p1  ORF type:complete len:114 (+),score=22.66 GEMP01124308.1:172-513(+)